MPSANILLTCLFYLWRKDDVTLFTSRIVCLLIADMTQLNWTMHHFRFHSAKHVATELTRPTSGGLCHLVCNLATCVWDQSSWHRWATAASAACVVQLGAVTDWWCSWPMANMLACLCSCHGRHFEQECIIKAGNVMFHSYKVAKRKWWGGHFSYMCTKFILLTTMQKL